MESIKKTALILKLVDTLEKKSNWLDEKHIQKAVYCLQNITQVSTQFNFILYKHAPFSFDFQDELNLIRTSELLNVNFDRPYGPHFSVSTSGRRLINKFSAVVDKYKKQISFIAKNFENKELAELERFASALYVKLNYNLPSAEARAERLNGLQPHLLIDKALEAVKDAERIFAKWQRI